MCVVVIVKASECSGRADMFHDLQEESLDGVMIMMVIRE